MPPTRVFFLPGRGEQWWFMVGLTGTASAQRTALATSTCEQPGRANCQFGPFRTAVAFVDIHIQGIIIYLLFLFFTILTIVIFLFYMFFDNILTCISPGPFSWSPEKYMLITTHSIYSHLCGKIFSNCVHIFNSWQDYSNFWFLLQCHLIGYIYFFKKVFCVKFSKLLAYSYLLPLVFPPSHS